MNTLGMTQLSQIKLIFSRWIDILADTIVVMSGRFVTRRFVQFVEGEDGFFQLQQSDGSQPDAAGARWRIVDGNIFDAPADLDARIRGSRADLILRPNRFLFRPLELPRRASEFLDGIVRAQIDRLTPWSAGDADFGWSNPIEIPNDRILVTVAATAHTGLTPLLRAMSALGAEAIRIFTISDQEASDADKIKVFEQTTRGGLNLATVRGVLVGLLLIAILAAALANAASSITGSYLEARQDELSRSIAIRRAALRLGGEAAETSALRTLEQRKHTVPSSVVVLEALSKLLPDNTYVTELRIEGDKLQVIGVTQDAPSLIRLMEQSRYFVHAAFFAPTTRAPGDPGDRFHIEARIEPIYEPPT